MFHEDTHCDDADVPAGRQSFPRSAGDVRDRELCGLLYYNRMTGGAGSPVAVHKRKAAGFYVHDPQQARRTARVDTGCFEMDRALTVRVEGTVIRKRTEPGRASKLPEERGGKRGRDADRGRCETASPMHWPAGLAESVVDFLTVAEANAGLARCPKYRQAEW
jgi:hypothetical protein